MIWMTLSVNPSSSLYVLAESSQYFGRTSVSWQNIRISICDNSSIKMTKVTLFLFFIRSVYITMGSVSPILLETQHELQKTTELQNNNVTFSFLTQHVIKCLQFQTFLDLHNFLDHPFRLVFLAG